MSRTLQRFTVIIATLVGAAAPIRSQVVSGQPASTDSAFARARALVSSGNGAAGRLLVDSVLAATDPASPAYAEALYWHAMLAANDGDAERDYRRIVVEYALAPRAADALLQVAQLESAHGDRSSAATHLARFFAENPSHPERARAGALLTRLLFEQNDLPRACSALRQTLAVLPDSAVEARNQLTYYAPRCTALDVNPGSRVPVSGGAGRPSSDSGGGRRDSVVARAAPARYTLQVAAYGTKAEADRAAARLRARDIDARVVGGKKPFRVRIGRYTTRGNAIAAQRELRSKKVTAFVTDIEPEDK
ncbi:MAG TPA: SPOR domain-containing protein [Gemmatimonadaceae bacterium]|nr:SPOR domain-containing protein [Gemmatimonadaceae bacterium]